MLGLFLFLLSLYYLVLGKQFRVILFFLFFATGGFQIFPQKLLTLPEAGISKTYDFGLILLVLHIFINYASVKKVFLLPEFRWIRYIMGFVVVEVLVSLFVFKYSGNTVFRVLRSYLFFLVFLLFNNMSFEQMKSIFRFMIWLTFVQSILYILQNPLGTQILTNGLDDSASDMTNMVSGIVRYYQLPALLVPCFIYVLVRKTEFSAMQRLLILLLFMANVLLSFNRNLLFAFVIIGLFYFILTTKASAILIYVFPVIFALTLVYSFWGDRIDEGFQNVSALNELSLKSDYIQSNYSIAGSSENSSMYRAFHFLERLEYVIGDKIRFIFGIGFLTEDAPQANKLNFSVGLIDPITKDVSQIDTGDITWSRLILQLGVVGSALYLAAIIGYIITFFKKRKNSFAFMIFGMLFVELLISLYSVELASPHLRMMLGVSILLYIRSIPEKKSEPAMVVNS